MTDCATRDRVERALDLTVLGAVRELANLDIWHFLRHAFDDNTLGDQAGNWFVAIPEQMFTKVIYIRKLIVSIFHIQPRSVALRNDIEV